MEALTWDPETIKLELRDDLQVQLSEPAFDRLMAAILLVTTNRFERSLPDFIEVCNILSGDTASNAQFDPADVQEIAWGLTEWLALNGAPAHDEPDPFTKEICAYIGAQLDNEGLLHAPDVLKIALRDQAPVLRASTEFADDPVMFESIYQVQQGHLEDLEAFLRDSLQRLKSQLLALRLTNGETSRLFGDRK
jgi:hypothetical protein